MGERGALKAAGEMRCDQIRPLSRSRRVSSQAAFQRNRDHMDPSDEAEYERYCQEAMFRIQILEQRLDRHTELSLQKYAEMDARLRDDPRLVNLKLTSR